MNHKMMITAKDTPRFVMDLPVFIIFQQEAAEEKLIKCAYQYDGAAFNRNNGGCGVGESQDCDDPLSAYNDRCPDDKSKWADETCPSVVKQWCGQEPQATNCFWRGPAWFSPVHPGASPDFSSLNRVNELRNMTLQRVASQSSSVSGFQPGSTEFWNEIAMDGRILTQLLEADATQVIAAFGYDKSNSIGKTFAQQFNDELFEQYKVRVPLIAMDKTVFVGQGGVGPFQAESEAHSDQGPWERCQTGHCCNPYAAVQQLCPGGERCEECGGFQACQCPSGSFSVI